MGTRLRAAKSQGDEAIASEPRPRDALARAAMTDDIAAFGRIPAVETALRVLRRVTHLRIALVARVTPESWTACAVLDDAGFGLRAGDVLELSDTY